VSSTGWRFWPCKTAVKQRKGRGNSSYRHNGVSYSFEKVFVVPCIVIALYHVVISVLVIDVKVLGSITCCFPLLINSSIM
jgi:hypothetical protein